MVDLAEDCCILDLSIFGKQEGFAEDNRQCAVALERQKDSIGPFVDRLSGHDAQIRVVRLLRMFPRTEVDFIGPFVPSYDQKAIRERTTFGDFQSGHKPL